MVIRLQYNNFTSQQYVQFIKQYMQNQAAKRKNRLQAIRNSLKQNPVLKTNTTAVENKVEKRRKRRESVQFDQKLTESQKNILLEEDDTSVKAMVKFHEKYEMGSKIGQGSNGFVKKCYLKSTRQLFAVKSMRMDEEHMLFLKKNFKDIYSLDHPNIIKYRNMYLDLKNQTCFLVMDYENNPSLSEYKDLKVEEVKLIIHQLLDTLAQIHSCNICHRDVKPDNILYNRGNKIIKLVDFGISKKFENRGNKKEMLTITGTIYYQAPEIFIGGGYDEKVDVWAVGITFYQLVTGKTPFQSENHNETISNIERGVIQFDDSVWEPYGKSAKDLVSRLLKKKAQERFSAQDAKKHFWFNKKSSMPVDLTKSDSLNFKLGQAFPHTQSKYVEDTDCIRSIKAIPKLAVVDLMKKFIDQSSDSDSLIEIQSEGEEEEKSDSPCRTPANNNKSKIEQKLDIGLTMVENSQIQSA